MLLLLVLTLEFESHLDGIVNLQKKKRNRNQLRRAPSVGRRNSTRVDERRNGLSLFAIKLQVTYRGGEGGEELGMQPRI